jgi:hypothetical protein
MKKIKGKCHCGNIRYEFLWPQAGSRIPVRACSCTFCTKHGGVYTSHPDGQLTVQISDPALVNKYSFGTKTAEFQIFENFDPADLDTSVTDFNRESVGERLERRKQKWISKVRIEMNNS